VTKPNVIESSRFLEMDQDVEMPVSAFPPIAFGFSHPGGLQDKAAELAEEWICMTSPDGFTFLVKGKVAVVSGTLKNSLTSNFRSCHRALPQL